MGESFSNKITGMEDCGISRDLNESKDLSFSEAFHACEETGYIYPMGTVYASVWWNIYQEIQKKEPQELERFHVFYLEYLKQLKGSFDFIDAFQSIKKLDSQVFGSTFTPYFRKRTDPTGTSLRLIYRLIYILYLGDIRKVSITFITVHTITQDKFIGNLKTGIVHLVLNFDRLGLS